MRITASNFTEQTDAKPVYKSAISDLT